MHFIDDVSDFFDYNISVILNAVSPILSYFGSSARNFLSGMLILGDMTKKSLWGMRNIEKFF